MLTTIYNVIAYTETATEKKQFSVNEDREKSVEFTVFGVVCARARLYTDDRGGVNVRVYCSSGVKGVLIGAHARCSTKEPHADTEVLRFYPVEGGNGNVSVSCETKWVPDPPAPQAKMRAL